MDGDEAARYVAKHREDLTRDAAMYYDQFTKQFFSPNADGNIMVTETQQQEAFTVYKQAANAAAVANRALAKLGIEKNRDSSWGASDCTTRSTYYCKATITEKPA